MGAGGILYSLYKKAMIFVAITTPFRHSPENDHPFAQAQC
jgi:hypothetical protein